MADAQELIDSGVEHQKGGKLDEALECYRAAVDLAQEPGLASEALRRQASVHRTRSEWTTALELAHRAAEVASAADLPTQFAEALNAMALVHQARGNFDEAQPLLERIVGLTVDQRIRGVALQNLGSIAAQSGDFQTARQHFLASHRCFQQAGYLWGEAFVLNNFGRAAVDHQNHAVAAPMLESAVSAARRVGDSDLQALATLNYAEAIAGLGDLPRADALARSALEYYTTQGNAWRRVECLRILGDIAARARRLAAARRHYEEGLAFAREIGATVEMSVIEGRLAELPASDQ